MRVYLLPGIILWQQPTNNIWVWNMWNPCDLTFCHRCKHIMYFTGTSVSAVWQSKKGKTNRSGTQCFTISNQTGIKQMWQGYKSALWKCSRQLYFMKSHGLKRKRRHFVVHLSMFSIFIHVLYLSNKLISSSESQVCKTVVLMSRRTSLVLQSQMYSWIPLEVNPSSYLIIENVVHSSGSPIYKYRVEDVLMVEHWLSECCSVFGLLSSVFFSVWEANFIYC